MDELERPGVGGPRLVGPVESPQEFGARRVEVVVALQLEPVDEPQRAFRVACLSERRRAIQLDDRRAGAAASSP